jgi:hypothetical protein
LFNYSSSGDTSKSLTSMASEDLDSVFLEALVGAFFLAYFSLKLNLMKALSKASYSLSSLDYSAGV